MISIWTRKLLFICLLLGLCYAAAFNVPAETLNNTAYQVWAVDQNGNRVYILNPDGQLLRSIDLAEQVRAERPHLVTLSKDGKTAFFANTASNSISIHRTATGEAVTVIENVGKAPHAAQQNPYDPDRVYVFNIAPQVRDSANQADGGETITELVLEENTWRIGRRLDLAAAPALADTDRFPSRRPVLAGFAPGGRIMLVSLFHGGVAAVDLQAWQVTDAWGSDQIREHATVLVASPDGKELYLTAGSKSESWLYVFQVAGKPTLVASHNLSTLGQDAHGAAIDPVRNELWVVHRASSNATVHPLATIRSDKPASGVVPFVGKIPDLIAISPDGQRGFVTLRGPNPAPTIPFPLTGEAPGVAIIDIPGRKLLKTLQLGVPTQGDFHGIEILVP
jgi:DNA-binding beta-propeller fold protein YncE